MTQQRQRSRGVALSGSINARALVSGSLTVLPTTEDLHKYHTDRCESKIIGWIDDSGFKTQGNLQTGSNASLVLDKTCFYAESGGQVGDCGIIESQQGQFVVEETAKIANCVVHTGKVTEGTITVGDNVVATVGKDRDSIKKNHTATHLLQWALQQVIGTSVAQQGSLVAPDYLRFDFTCPTAPAKDQIKQTEVLIRQKINANMPVTCAVMDRNDARKIGAMALFGEKYGNEVRVVAIGAENEDQVKEALSKEFCGGTHVDKTGAIGDFKIVKEESISAGVRRITALTGSALADYLEKRSDIIDELSLMLKVPPDGLPQRVHQPIKDNKNM